MQFVFVWNVKVFGGRSAHHIYTRSFNCHWKRASERPLFPEVFQTLGEHNYYHSALSLNDKEIEEKQQNAIAYMERMSDVDC